jgi:CRISPR/Cas system CSM-associated protein Csm3 (group 7 of RAMP superfamily)
MNPYDFVPIVWDRQPQRKEPFWHHRLARIEATSNPIYSGRIEMQIEAEGPIFLPQPGANEQQGDSARPQPFLHMQQGDQTTYILPGSSLKGMLRMLVETLGNGCLTLFDERYKRLNYREKVPYDFRHCSRNNELCIACRIFGTMGKGKEQGVFLGKINVSDAYSITAMPYAPQYTLVLMMPKPHHKAFYLDQTEEHITGRKYYFHHATPTFADEYKYSGENRLNRFIQPLGRGSCFQFSVDFTCLEVDEFAALLLALVLQPDMRHKIGYGKPMGLGSVRLSPTKLTLIDYAKRYTPQEEPTSDDREILSGPALDTYIYEHIKRQAADFLLEQALTDLRRIWQWPPANIQYQYPDREWFNQNSTATIKQTP